MREKSEKKLSKWFIDFIESPITPYAVLCILALFMLSPIILMFLNSFKSITEAFSWPPTIFPRNLSLEAYIRVFTSDVPLTLRNSIIISLTTTFIVVCTALPTAYGLSRYPYRGSRLTLLFFLISRIIPPLSLLVPFYLLLSHLRLVNTFLGLIIVDTYLSLPLVIWMLKGFFDEFPQELIDSALIDGCSKIGAFLRVVLPLTSIAIAAAAIITFLWTWNEFIYAMVFTTTSDVSPITVGIFTFVGDEVIEWNSMCAVGVFTSLPAILFFIFAQKYVVEGLTKGAIKG